MRNNPIETIAVTGATGTIGVSLITQAIKRNIKVIAFVNSGSMNINRIPKSDLVRVIACSLADLKVLPTEGLSADVFFHLAWASTNRAVRNNLSPQVDNIRYSLDSVDLAERLGCHSYIGAGSQAEYGRKSSPLNEETFPSPETAYGMAKLCSGQMTRLACKNKGMRHIWPRILSTYGPYTQDTTILNYTISCLLNGNKPSLTGCEQIWDFIYVDDAARALLLLAEKGTDGDVYCIGSGTSRMMKDYILEISNRIDPSIPVGFGDIPYNESTVMHLVGDIKKIKRDTGFEPQIPFSVGIEKTISWARKYYLS